MTMMCNDYFILKFDQRALMIPVHKKMKDVFQNFILQCFCLFCLLDQFVSSRAQIVKLRSNFFPLKFPNFYTQQVGRFALTKQNVFFFSTLLSSSSSSSSPEKLPDVSISKVSAPVYRWRLSSFCCKANF